MRNYLSILILLVYLFSCEGNENIEETNSSLIIYPTTINSINSDQLSQMRYEYHQTNYFILTSLNHFGFCDCCADFGSSYGSSPPPVLAEVSESYATEIADNFLILNKKHTGVLNKEEIQYSRKTYEKIGMDIYWHFKTSNQLIDSLEVIYSQIVVNVENGKVTWCTGNWYPEVYIPKTFNYLEEDVKSMLAETVVYHSDCWGSSWSEIVTDSILEESNFRKVIVPIETGSKIELRVSWEINVPNPVFYKFYIDVMTGEIVLKEPTIL